MLSVAEVTHRYPTMSAARPDVLRNVSFQLAAGEQLLLRGISGSGKTTLINILAGLLTPSTGNVTLNDQPMYALAEAKRDRFRRDNIGYVFQTHHLIPLLNAWENVALPLAFAGAPTKQRKRQSLELLDSLGLQEVATVRPKRMSNGQRQRVAIARALITRPSLILADEPTASLDAESANVALDMLQQTCRQSGTMLIVASHDPLMTEKFKRVVDLQYGAWLEQ